MWLPKNYEKRCGTELHQNIGAMASPPSPIASLPPAILLRQAYRENCATPSKSVENERLCKKAGAASDAANPMMKRYTAPEPLSNDLLRIEWKIERGCSG